MCNVILYVCINVDAGSIFATLLTMLTSPLSLALAKSRKYKFTYEYKFTYRMICAMYGGFVKPDPLLSAPLKPPLHHHTGSHNVHLQHHHHNHHRDENRRQKKQRQSSITSLLLPSHRITGQSSCEASHKRSYQM